MSTELSTSNIVIVNNPLSNALHPGYSAPWVEPALEEPDDEDNYITSLFEDLPVAQAKDYVEVDLYENDCQCDECLGIYYDDRYDHDDRDDYQDDYGGGTDWNESGYFD